MLVLPGAAALSAFRAAKILSQIQSLLPTGCAVHARFVYFVNPVGKLEAAQLANLQKLLGVAPSRGAVDGELELPNEQNTQRNTKCSTKQSTKQSTKRNAAAAAPANAFVRIVTPRLGTISAWSTKATDILHHCGLTAVARVERGIEWRIDFQPATTATTATNAPPPTDALLPIIHDRMTESVLRTRHAARALFQRTQPPPLAIIDLLGAGRVALQQADADMGLALSEVEQRYLLSQFSQLGRNPTDVELMTFAQVNSEHCRHKIFNAEWHIDGRAAQHSLFDMIRETHRRHGGGTLSAYHDNAAVLAGPAASRFQVEPRTRRFVYLPEPGHTIAKVETHNHPTAISPFAGAATGVGGEIRDEGATGRGGKPKAGVVGYAVSHLRLPGARRSWEGAESRPTRLASPLQIMLEAPLGAAAFNNEFGRPTVVGYFRTFEQTPPAGDGAFRYGYHKPIMLVGGVGNIRPSHVGKRAIPDGAPIVVLGGPAMLIGLGGGAASSVAAGAGSEALEFASVQRGNPEMQRRCQEVIDSCCALGEQSPIVSIHDVGAGGLCNAVPELVHDSARGGEFELRDALSDEPGMTPMQIWCNESQERYVLAIEPARFAQFEKICRRERCLYSRIGRATAAQNLRLRDRHFAAAGGANATPMELPMETLFGSPPSMQRRADSLAKAGVKLSLPGMSIARATKLVLGFPTVADKTFLVTIGDRSVTGLVARDQMVGPWQVPVADVGVTAGDYCANHGEAMAVGERAPLAVLDAPASARMAVGEAITNIAAARLGELGNIKLSANWMVAAGEPGHDADLFNAVQAVALDLCPKLGISIPVGKDSMCMQSVWRDQAQRACQVVAPLSLVVTAFSTVRDIRATLTPQLAGGAQNDLWLVDLGNGNNRLGGSVLAQATAQMGDTAPDVTDANHLKAFFNLLQTLSQEDLVLAYHDRSDGGLMTTLCEMAFAARCGLAVELGGLHGDPLAILFNEELGAVLQTRTAQREQVVAQIQSFGMGALAHRIGHATAGDEIIIRSADRALLRTKRAALHRVWSETTWRMQALRDHPQCADQEYARIDDLSDPGLFSKLTFTHDLNLNLSAPYVGHHPRPKIAILREQGVNGQLEMAAAFDRVGFSAVDVTMGDLAAGQTLADYKGFAACGGFSFGDVLGAGAGWAKSILYHARLRDIFAEFFQRSDTFALGVCNGCQMMAAIAELVPGAAHWPRFTRNLSEQYEARVVMLEVCSDKSVLLRDMQGSMLPVSTAHGEGRVQSDAAGAADLAELQRKRQVCLRFVDNRGQVSETYPFNPNGSRGGVTGFTNEDGRFTIMMPHPERVFRAACNSWRPGECEGRDEGQAWGEYSPWIKIFKNARDWVA